MVHAEPWTAEVRKMKFRQALLSIAALSLVAAGVMACGGSDDKKSDEPTEVKVALTVEGCSPATIKTKTGPTKFVVTNNNAPAVSELEILEGNYVLGEVENIKPGTSRSFTI